MTIFGPDPLLSVTIERAGQADEVHIHPAGQGVWVARMAAQFGARPILCGFRGGETGDALAPLLESPPAPRRGGITLANAAHVHGWRRHPQPILLSPR